MNKKELVSTMADKTGLTKKEIELALNSFTETITEALSKGDNIALIGFGTFSTSKRASREGRNPSTGKTITIPATTVAKFKAGKTLKDGLN